jgi:hypothetical protein
MNKITYSISKNTVLSAGKHFGIQANWFAEYFGFTESSKSTEIVEGWEDLLPLIP